MSIIDARYGIHGVWVVDTARETENLADYLAREMGIETQYLNTDIHHEFQREIIFDFKSRKTDVLVVTPGFERLVL